MWNMLKPKYRVVKYIRLGKPAVYIAQRRWFRIFWCSLLKPVFVGSMDMLELEVHHNTEEEAIEQIHEDYEDSLYYHRTSRKIIHIEDYDGNIKETHGHISS